MVFTGISRTFSNIGKDADLTLFEGDPFEVMSSPEMVMIGGERIEL